MVSRFRVSKLMSRRKFYVALIHHELNVEVALVLSTRYADVVLTTGPARKL